MWPDWADTVSCIHIGHLITQIVVFSTSWTPSLHLQFKIEVFHYITACAINIMCLSTRQMAAIVLLSIVAQLPILFSTVNTIVSKSLCPCLWISNWIMWVITQVTCYFRHSRNFLNPSAGCQWFPSTRIINSSNNYFILGYFLLWHFILVGASSAIQSIMQGIRERPALQ